MARPRFEFAFKTVGAQPRGRCCDVPGCLAEGQFRAPRSRQELDSYFWFCLEHVRAYNASWNYYAGMNEQEIESELRRDTVWQRPTWPMGWRTAQSKIHDQLHAMRGDEERDPGPVRRSVYSPEEKALQLFDLVIPFTLTELKRRYKVLVKLYHPDANGGDKAAEERLKVINQAYTLLKTLATPAR
jgi:hypothetical protein